MYNLLFKIMASGILLAGLTGCIGGGGQPLDENTANTVITSLATNVLSKLPTSANAPSLPNELGGISLSSQNIHSKAAACETITPAVLVDADSDGIAAEKKYTFNCTNLGVGGDRFTRKGELRVLDKDDTVAGLLGGLKVEFDVSSFRMESGDGSVADYTFLGAWDYEKQGTSLVSYSKFDGRFFYSSVAYDFKLDYKYGYTWDYKMTPNNSNQFFNSGTIEFSGEFVMDGEFYTEDQSGKHHSYSGIWKINYESSNLSYDNTCSKWYKTGSIRINDGGSTVYELRYNCTEAKFFVNGAESDLYTP